MRYFLSVVCFAVVQWSFAQQRDFNFEMAWEAVYREELKDLPRSASQKVDSIYSAAERLNRPKQRVKALIYQAKFMALLEEDVHQQLYDHFKAEFEKSEQPTRNILHSHLARTIHEIYNKVSWQIRNRSRDESEGDQLDTWDESRYLEAIAQQHLASLQMPDSLRHSPLKDFEILTNGFSDSVNFRPYLYDLLAHEALNFLERNEFRRNKPAEPFDMKNPQFLAQPEAFVALNIEDADSGSYFLKSLKIYQELTALHLADEEPWALVDLTIRRLSFVKAKGQVPEIERHYRHALQLFQKSLGEHEAAAIPMLERAIFENDLGSKYSPLWETDHQFKKQEAVAICDSLIALYPQTLYANQATALKNNITHAGLYVTMEAYILPDEPTKLLATFQNLDALYFRTYRIRHRDLKTYKRSFLSDSVRNAQIPTLTAQESWDGSLINERDYQEHRQELLVPGHPPGAYLLMVYEDEARTQPLAWDLMQVTRLGIAALHDPHNSLYRVFDRQNGLPLAAVDASFYYIANDTLRDEIHLQSDESGLLATENLNSYRNQSLQLRLGRDTLTVPDQYIGSNISKPKVNEEAYIIEAQLFTDRGIYRPGQKLYFKAIVFKQQPQASTVVAGETVTITLYDENDQDLWYDHFTTNEFGSVAGEVTLPKKGLTGTYRLEIEAEDLDSKVFDNAENELQVSEYFSVEEYKRPRFEINFDKVTEAYRVNDSVFVKGEARSLAASPLSGAKVTYQVHRKVYNSSYRNYSRGWQYYGRKQVAFGELKTDEAGKFTIPFKAEEVQEEIDEERTNLEFEIEVTVTDINGETRENSTKVLVAKNPYTITLTGREEYSKGLDAMPFKATVKTLNDFKKTQGGTITIKKLEAPGNVVRNVPWGQPDYQGYSKEVHERLFPHWPYEGNASPDDWPVGASVYEQPIEAGKEGNIKVNNFNGWRPGYYKATFHALTEAGDSLQASHVFLLQNAQPRQLPDKVRFAISLDKETYYPGDTAIVTFGSAAEGLGFYYTLARSYKHEFEQHFVSLQNEVRQIRIPIEAGDERGLRLYYYTIAHNDFQEGTLEIKVFKKWPKLQLTTGTFRNKLQPGAPEQWSFKVRGEDGEAASAELLASMYDASLDQLRPFRWQFDPFFYQLGHSYNQTSTLSTFGVNRFRNLMSYTGFDKYYPVHQRWHRFGLSVRNPKFEQDNYVRSLRFRRKMRVEVGSEKRDFPSGTVKGIVLDEVGNPMFGATVYLVGTRTGDVVDEDGSFSLEAQKGQSLRISFIGYKTFSLTLTDDNYYQIQLTPDYSDLAEVVVVSSVMKDKKELMLSVPEVTFDMEFDEEVAEEVGVFYSLDATSYAARDMTDDGSSLAMKFRSGGGVSSDTVFVLVDGVPATEQAAPPSPDMIASLQYLPGIEAKPIYGPEAANGVILITTNAELARQNALLAQVKARTNLKETAFFFPQLRTNEAGEVSFEFESPESLTRWKLQLLAHGKNLASAIMSQTVDTQKELMVLPNFPRYFREGDRISISAKIASLSTDSLAGFARLELFDALTEEPVQSVVVAPAANPRFEFRPSGNVEVSWQLEIPDGLQAVRYRIVAVAGDFSDGEESVLPVLSKRMLVHESQPLWVNANTAKTFELDKLSNNASASLKHHQLSLQVTTNPVWEAIRSLPYLMEYPYECAEQTFARFYANQLGAHIIEQQPDIKTVFEKWRASGALVSKLEQNQELKAMLIEETPWLREAKSETEQQKQLAVLFDLQRLAEEKEASLDKLRDMQLSSGAFPWFAGSDRPNRYITQHIVTGLTRLGMHTSNTKDFIDIQRKGVEYMSNEFTKSYQSLVSSDSFDPAKKHIGFMEVQYLYVLTLIKPRIESENWAEAVDFYSGQAYRYWSEMSLQSKAMIALIAQANGNKKQAKRIMRSLKEYAIESEELGNYWKANVSGWYNWQAPIETQAMMIEAFSRLTKDEDFVNGLRKWLLSHKRTHAWASTKATTDAIHALLTFGSDWTGSNNQVRIMAGAETILSPGQTESGAEAGKGYLKKIWNAEQIEPELGKVVIENNGKTQVWGGLHWQYFEDLDKITSSMGPLSVQKQLYLVKQTDRGEVLEAISDNSQIQLGDLVRVKMILKADRSMEFIHLKDMRAAGFEPVNVLSSYKWQDGLGYYESTRDAATNFFIEYMPKGTFVFEYDLRANNAGNFSNGITSIQNMYAPEFSSHTEGIKVIINE